MVCVRRSSAAGGLLAGTRIRAMVEYLLSDHSGSTRVDGLPGGSPRSASVSLDAGDAGLPPTAALLLLLLPSSIMECLALLARRPAGLAAAVGAGTLGHARDTTSTSSGRCSECRVCG